MVGKNIFQNNVIKCIFSIFTFSISGPNTWQEWSREGRRPYPMLPRVAPQTALALIANNVAEETAQENSKLQYPAETADAIKEEQLQTENQKSSETVEPNNYIVTNDPVSTPELSINSLTLII